MTTRVLAVAALLCAPALARADLRLGHDVVPTFESIRLELDPARPDYTGSVRIELTVAARADSFRFHAREMSIQKLVLRGTAGVVAATHREGEGGLVVVRPERPIAPGPYDLEIEFANDFDTRATSLYRLEIGGHAYAFTQFEADDAREAFPCWDEPEFKIPWQLTLVVPATDLALSNTPIEKETARRDAPRPWPSSARRRCPATCSRSRPGRSRRCRSRACRCRAGSSRCRAPGGWRPRRRAGDAADPGRARALLRPALPVRASST